MPNREFDLLSDERREAVLIVVEWAQKAPGRHVFVMPHGVEVYAYRSAHGHVHWGVNSGPEGFCTHRGVWPESKP